MDEPTRNTQGPRPTAIGPRRRPLALAVAALLAPVSAGAAPEWGPNLEVLVQGSEQRILGGMDLLAPVFQNARNLTYLELKGAVSDQRTQEANFGLGHRWITPNDAWIIGGFLQYDYRNTENVSGVEQWTLGLEALGERFDARFNWYEPQTDAQRIQGWVGGIQYSGHRTYTQETYEEPLGGWDAEVGVLLPLSQRIETRVYAGAYGLNGDLNGDTTGWMARLEVRPLQSLGLEVGYREDDIFGSEWALTVRYAFGYPAKPGIRTLRQRMIETTRRDLDVRVTPPEVTPRQEHLLAANTVHIDAARGGAGGDGTYERPFGTVGACLAGGCGGSGSLVRLWQGGTRPGSEYRVDGGWRLNPGQTLWGEGWVVNPTPTARPDYGNWLGRGFADLGRNPWLRPISGPAGVLMADGSSLLGVAIDTRGVTVQSTPSGIPGTSVPSPDLGVPGNPGTPVNPSTPVNPNTPVNPGTPAPAVLADGASSFNVLGNVLLTDAVGVQVQLLRADLSVALQPETPDVQAGTAPSLAWGVPDGSPVQGRILDNLVLTPVDPTGLPSAGAAVALTNLAQGGAESRQVLVYRGLDPRPAAPALAALALDGVAPAADLRLDNRAEGAGSVAVQQVLLIDTDLDLNGATLGLTNSAADRGRAEQDLRLIGGSLSGAGVTLRAENTATAGSIARQTLAFDGVAVADLSASLDLRNSAAGADADGAPSLAEQGIWLAGPMTLTGISLSNTAQGGATATQGLDLAEVSLAATAGRLTLVNEAQSQGRADQGLRLTATGLDLGTGVLHAHNTAVGEGAATQQLEIAKAGGGTLAGLDLLNEARGGTAVQQADLDGLSLASPDGIETWAGLVNGAFGAASATQAVRLANLGLDLPSGGFFIGTGAFDGAQASQTLRVEGQGSAAWFSAVNQAAVRASSDQRIAVSGLDLARSPEGKGGIEASATAIGVDARAGQALALDLGVVEAPAVTVTNLARDGGTSAQGLDLSGEMGLDAWAADNRALGSSSAAQYLTLTASDLRLASAKSTNRAETEGAGYQYLTLANTGAGELGALHLGNSVNSTGTAVQELDGTGLPILNAVGRLTAENTAGGGVATQDLALATAAADAPGTKPVYLYNAASYDGVARQSLTLTGDAEDPGLLGAMAFANQAEWGEETWAGQSVDIAGLGVDAGTALAVPNGTSVTANHIYGLVLTNLGDRGSAAQRLALDTGDRAMDAERLSATNSAGGGGRADQTLDLAGAEGALAALSLGNGAGSGATAAQDIALTGPGLNLSGDFRVVNEAEWSGAQAEQTLDLAPASLHLGTLSQVTFENQGTYGRAEQDLRLAVTGALDSGEAAATSPRLTFANSATGAEGAASQTLDLSAADLDLTGRGLTLTNEGLLGAEAGQSFQVAVDSGGALGGIEGGNKAEDVATADQGLDLRGLSPDGRLAFANLATGADAAGVGSRATQALDLEGALAGATLEASTSAATSGRAEQSLTLAGTGEASLTGLTLGVLGTGGGVAQQTAVVSGVRIETQGEAAVDLGGGADGGRATQILELTEAILAGGDQALRVRGQAVGGGVLTQQATFRDSTLSAADVDILVDPSAPADGEVVQHLALWGTPAGVRFLPTLIRDRAETANVHQSYTIDGVRQPIWRQLVLPSGATVPVDEGGDPNYSAVVAWNPGGGFTSVVTNINPGGFVIGTQTPNLGTYLSPEAAALVQALYLGGDLSLPAGALRYLDDLQGRRAAGLVPGAVAED